MEGGNKHDVISEYVTFEGKACTLGGYLSRPSGKGPYPAVMVIHDIYGLSDHTKSVTAGLAREGFIGFSVNLASRAFGPDAVGGSDEIKDTLKNIADDDAMADLDAGLDYLKGKPVVFTNSLGCMGFCMGGRFTLLFAARRQEFKAAVSFYGPPIDKEKSSKYPKSAIELVPEMHVPLLGNYGTEDHVIPVENVAAFERELKKHNKIFDIKLYQGAKHGFHKPGPSHDPEAAADAWKRTVNWFATYLNA